MRSVIDPPLCVALDTPDLDVATRLVDVLVDRVQVFKVGFELFTAQGPAAVQMVRDRGREVFLDLKVGDIPNTAKGAVRSARRIGARFLTVHGSGGREMLEAAVDAARDGGPELLVVSVLTSLDEDALRRTGVERPLSDQVDSIASLAASVGAPGLVLAASEIARVRAVHPNMFLLVPGMRPAWASSDDQKRMGTPAEAVRDGADMIVLGRAITAADDPADAMDRVLDEIAGSKVGS